MLVLSRKVDESVVIGGSKSLTHVLKVTVIEVTNGKVRLGIEAPADVPVHRWEVWERIHARAQRARTVDAIIDEVIQTGAP